MQALQIRAQSRAAAFYADNGNAQLGFERFEIYCSTHARQQVDHGHNGNQRQANFLQL